MSNSDNSSEVKIPIERIIPDSLSSKFSNNVVVQFQDDSFIISFFEVIPPMVISDSETERKKILESIKSVKAECVARIIVTPQKMEEIIAVMSQNLQNFKASK